MSQPNYAVIRLKWSPNLTVALNAAILALVRQHKAEVRVVSQSHDDDEILFTVEW